MSDDCELEVEYGVDQQEVIEDIAGLVETEFAAAEEEVGEDDQSLVIQEEVVINDMVDNGINFVDEEVDDDEEEEEEDEDIEGDNEEAIDGSDGNEMLSNDDINSQLMTEENSLNDNDSNNELIIDSNDGEEVVDDVPAGDEKVGENEVYQWSAFTGLRVKTFTAEELIQFRRPFELGWKREVVLRGTVTSSGKKIGDVYYFSPDKKTKLRSYVEMGLYLRKSVSELDPKNFTFARQPIYRPPDEIVRHAMQRGGGQHQVQPSQIIDSSPFTPAPAIETEPKPASTTSTDRSARNSTASESEEQFSMSIAEGRAKRKRVAPTRFEDEDYSESPLKKGRRDRGPSIGNGSQSVSVVSGGKPPLSLGQKAQLQPKPHLSLQEKRRQLQHQLLQQVHEQSLKKQALEGNKQMPNSDNISDTAPAANGEPSLEVSTNNTETEINVTKIDANGKPHTVPLNARKSISASAPPVVRPKTEPEDTKTPIIGNDVSDKSEADPPQDQVSGAPCSMHCPGRRGMLPNLMCSRCFCLYHLDCVPGGVFLEEPRVFVCPNCLKPEDTQRCKDQKLNGQSITQNGITEDMDCVPQLMPKAMQSLLVSTAPILIQQPLVKPRSTFAPILPKPPQLQHSQLYQQHQQMMQKMKRLSAPPVQPLAPFNKSAAMNVKLPVGTHLYRVATGPNGHSIIVKDKSIKPKVKNARKSIGAITNGSANALHNGFHYRPAPIAPIGPIKLTPQQIQRQLREILHPSKGRKRRGYRDWMERHRTAVQSLVTPYSSLNQVLSYLTVTDLVRLRQVSRDWNRLSSQPFLWRRIQLKGVQINDWQYLSRNVIEFNSTTDLDFDGIKHFPNTTSDLCDLWRNFAIIIDFLKSVRHLRFGSIPTSVLEEIVTAAVTENPYNSFANLEHLSVRNCFEEDSDVKDSCHLTFLNDFHVLKSLKSLHINSKNGFIADQSAIDLLAEVFKTMSLETLVFTSLKDFSSHDFRFLTSLQSLKHLEIGSCVNWFQTDVETNEDEPKEEEEIKDQNQLIGAFKFMSQLMALKSLRLVDITIDDCSQNLPQMLESLITLEALTIDNLKIEPSGMDVLDHLCTVLKCLSIETFAISTDDSHTNKCSFDLLKKLDNCAKLHWKVGVLVEDSGECFVPFKKDDDSAEDADAEPDMSADGHEMPDQMKDQSIKYMDLTFLNELIQSELSNAIIEIIPQ